MGTRTKCAAWGPGCIAWEPGCIAWGPGCIAWGPESSKHGDLDIITVPGAVAKLLKC